MVDLGFDGIRIKSRKQYFMPKQWSLCNQTHAFLEIQASGRQETVRRKNEEGLFEVLYYPRKLLLPSRYPCLPGAGAVCARRSGRGAVPALESS